MIQSDNSYENKKLSELNKDELKKLANEIWEGCHAITLRDMRETELEKAKLKEEKLNNEKPELKGSENKFWYKYSNH